MKTKSFNRKKENSSIQMELDQRREQIFESFIIAWNNLDDKSLKNVLTEDVKIIERDFSVISGIKDVIGCLNVVLRMINRSKIDPSVAIIPPNNQNEVNAFKVIIIDSPSQNLLFVFKMILRGEKVAEIETHYNEFFSTYNKYI